MLGGIVIFDSNMENTSMQVGFKGSLRMETRLISPCGLNCRLCRAYIRERNTCPGCLIESVPKPKTRVRCEIKTCTQRKGVQQKLCNFCSEFPCRPLQRLDKRYRTKYAVSPIANLERIKAVGIRKFVVEERGRWLCQRCDSVLCMHEAQCVNCGNPRRDG